MTRRSAAIGPGLSPRSSRAPRSTIRARRIGTTRPPAMFSTIGRSDTCGARSSSFVVKLMFLPECPGSAAHVVDLWDRCYFDKLADVSAAEDDFQKERKMRCLGLIFALLAATPSTLAQA